MRSIFRIIFYVFLVFLAGISELFAQCSPNTILFNGGQPIYNTACGNNSYQVISGSTPTGTGNTFRWEVSFSGGTYTTIVDGGGNPLNSQDIPKSDITNYVLVPAGNASGDYRIRRIVTNSGAGCSNISQPVFLYYAQNASTTSGGTISGNLVACSPGSGTLTVSGNTGPVLRWESSVDGGISWTPITNVTNTYSYSGLTSGTCYRALIDNICGANATAGVIDAADKYSATACVTINSIPVINVQPLSQGVCLGSGISLSVTATSATTISYQWRKNGFNINGANAASFGIVSAVNSDAGSYDVVMTNTCGPITSSAAVVTVNPLPIATVPANSVVCPGAVIPLTTYSSSPSGATFTWTNSNTAIGLAASGSGSLPSFTAVNGTTSAITATITVTPVLNGCAGPASSYTITVNPTAVVTVPTSFSVCGGATISATNFSSTPLGATYTWTNSNTAIGLADGSGSGNVPSFTAASSGTTTITVTPYVNGCAGTPSSYVITVNPLPVVSASATDETSCSANNGTITITASGTAPLEYSINGGTTYFANGNFTALSPGSYAVMVKSSSGCVTAGPILTVSSPGAPAKPNIDTSNSPVCEGQTIVVSVQQTPIPGATYTWTGPGGYFLSELTGTITRLNATTAMSGNYVVTVSVGGCVSDAEPFSIVVNKRPVVNQPPDLTFCAGASVPVSSFITTPAGATYTWTNSKTSIGLSAAGSGQISPFTAINNTNSPIEATITVTPRLNNCDGDPVVFKITIDPLPVIDPVADIIACHGATIPQQGFTSNITGTTFSWTVAGIGGTYSGSGSIPSFTAVNNGISPIVGTVTVTANVNGCTGSSKVYTITMNPRPRLTNAPLNQTTCAGTRANAVVLTSDVAGANFSWTAVSSSNDITGFTAIGTGNIPEELINNSGTVQGTVTYTIFATANGCTGPATSYVTRVDPLPKLLSSIVLRQTVCSGSPSTVVNLSSEVTGTLFNWTAIASSGSVTGFLAVGSGQTQLPSQILFNSGTTPQTVTYTIVPVSNGCSGPVSTYTITVNPLPTATISGDALVCYGADAVLNVALTGTAPWNITYSDGTSSFTKTGITTNSYSFTVSSTSTKTYTIVSVSDAICFNSGSGSATITQPSAPLTATASSINVSCFGSVNGSITFTSISGGSGNYQYSINNGSNWQNGNSFTGLTAATYSVQVRDAGNISCVLVVNAGLVVKQPAVLSGTVEFRNVTCQGAADGRITILNSGGGYGNFEYSINGGLNWQSSSVFNKLAPGLYNVQIRDLQQQSCQQILNSSIVIREASEPLISGISSIVNIDCFGANTGSVDLFVRGGVAPYSYVWSNGATTKELKNVSAGSYSVTITDSFNCTSIHTATISQPNEPFTINFSKTDVSCFGFKNGSISLTVTGGTGPYVYTWSNGKSTKEIMNLSVGAYTVSVTDSKSCSVVQQIQIGQPSQMLAVNVIKTNVSCFNGTDGVVKLSVSGGTAPYTYVWSSGQRTSDLIGIKQGNYNVTIIDANGCSFSQAVTITQPPTPISVSMIVKNTICKTTSDGMITALVSGGIAPYKLSWKGRTQTTSVLPGLAAGIYEINVVDALGCTFTASAEIIAGNCLPVAVNDDFRIYEGETVSGSSALNDFDIENQKLTYSLSGQPTNGKINFNSDGSFSYTPVPGYWGTQTIPYKICNTSGDCNTANIIIQVIPYTVINLIPGISNVNEGKKITITARLERPYKDDAIAKIVYSGVAVKDRDYVLLDQYLKIVIPKGQLSTTEKITVAALTDDIQEGDETINVKIISTSDPEVRIGTSTLVVISDVYPPPLPDLVRDKETPPNPDIITDPLMSPNGDGIGNETFTIQNIVSFPDNEVLIFNRWGNEVFRMKGYNESERVFKGYANTGMLTNTHVPLADGVYYFLITTRRTFEGTVITAVNKGYIVLKR